LPLSQRKDAGTLKSAKLIFMGRVLIKEVGLIEQCGSRRSDLHATAKVRLTNLTGH
jgi:hypothetical protein